MSLERGKLADIQWVKATPTALYSNPATKKSYIKGLTLHNTNTTTEAVKIYVVPDNSGVAGTAAASNRVYSISLAASETILLPLSVDGMPVILTDTNDSIFAESTTIDKVTVLIHGDRE